MKYNWKSLKNFTQEKRDAFLGLPKEINLALMFLPKHLFL